MSKDKRRTKKKKRSALTTVLIIAVVAVFLVGFGLLMYPTFSNLWNEYRNKQLITEYNNSVSDLTDDGIQEIWDAAKAYNDQHKTNTIVDAFGQEEDYVLTHPYDQLLNPSGDEVMGSIEIPKIGVSLAIYHGIGKEALQNGVGHVEGTSLPIGGAGTHAVLAGHRGLPSAKIFTDLDQMEVGDKFYIHVLNQTLAYQVDQIKTVLPEDTSDIAIVDGEDYVTLITCTPYGVNSHRLLVRGTRIPYEEAQEEEEEKQTEQQESFLEKYYSFILLAIGLIVFAIIVIVIVRKAKKNKRSQ